MPESDMPDLTEGDHQRTAREEAAQPGGEYETAELDEDEDEGMRSEQPGLTAADRAAEAREAERKVGVSTDKKSESASPAMYSLASWERSDYVEERDNAAKGLAAQLEVSEEQAKKYIDDVNGIAKMIADNRERLDYEASPGRSSFVGNSEYGGSIDFSTICKKRRLYTGTLDAIQRALPNTALTAEDVKRGTVPCFKRRAGPGRRGATNIIKKMLAFSFSLWYHACYLPSGRVDPLWPEQGGNKTRRCRKNGS